MLHNPFSSGGPGAPPAHGISGRPSLQLPSIGIPPSSSRNVPQAGVFSDARTHGFNGPPRAVTLPHAATPGAAAMSRNQAGDHCVVVGNASIRILKISDGAERQTTEYKFSIGNGGFRIDASKNFWSGIGARVDSALTDVVWCQKGLDTKIVTSSRNGELSLWDMNRSGALKFERKTRAHTRSINKLSYSSVMPNYCCSGSSDGKLRIWDLRDPTRATHTIHHVVEIRSVLYSPTVSDPFGAVTGLENGSLCRWDLRAGQKGILERIPLAHTGAILTFDWCDQYENGGWLASGGLDRTVKIWNFSGSHAHGTGTSAPSYTLHVSNPVRRVTWRPEYETELAIAYYNESIFSPALKSSQVANLSLSPASVPISLEDNASNPLTFPDNAKARQSPSMITGLAPNTLQGTVAESSGSRSGELVEVWDVRRPWLAKWTVNDSNNEGGVADMTFADSHALWVQNNSGTFSQMDLRFCDKPIDSIPRSAVTWNPTGSLTFVSDQPSRGTIPYDDRAPTSNPGERSETHKKLGDRRFTPSSQSIGTVYTTTDDDDWENFVRLAQGYRIEGCDKPSLCKHNAQVAFESGCSQAGQIWLLLQSLLLDIETYRPPRQLYQKRSIPAFTHSYSAPAEMPRTNRSPKNKPSALHSSSDEPPKSSQTSETLVATSSKNDCDSDLSRLLLSSGGDGDADTQRARSIAVGTIGRPPRELLRQRSLSKPARSTSTARRKVLGESALGDSESSEDELAGPSRTKTSPIARNLNPFSSVPSRIQSRLVSSPMVHDGEWAEDEREEGSEDEESDSMSNSESDDSNASTTAARSKSHRRPIRSRSSTIATMPGSAFLHPQPFLSRTDSYSSVQTVTMGKGANHSPATFGSRTKPQSLRHHEYSSPPPQSVSGVDSGRVALASPAPSRKSAKKRPSQAFISSGHQSRTYDDDRGVQDSEETRFLEWNHVAIKEAETAYRLATLDALRSSIASLADSGEIQLCATLSCIARLELGIPSVRALMFLESYMDMLTKLQLFTVLAYFRKYAPASKIREASQVMTTIYISCSTCGKPIDVKPGRSSRLTTSQCSKCKKTTLCTICHLPVRTMLMACTICSHGGHRECYIRYYLGRPMVILPQLGQDQQRRGRRPLRTADSYSYGTDNEASSSWGLESDISGGGGDFKSRTVRMTGHLCASGCGHVCWAASERVGSVSL